MRSNDDNDWPAHSRCCPSMIYAVFLCDDLSTVLRNRTFGSVSSRQTWPNYDNLRRSRVDKKFLALCDDVDLLPYILVRFCVVHGIICQTSVILHPSMCFLKGWDFFSPDPLSSAHTPTSLDHCIQLQKNMSSWIIHPRFDARSPLMK